MVQENNITNETTSALVKYTVPVDVAVEYGKAGLSVLPASKQQKRPLVAQWKDYQTHQNSEAQIRALWQRFAPDALCIVCGKVSGNLEVIDFDNGGESFLAWKAKIPKELFDKLVLERSQSGGFHVPYHRSQDAEPNRKLASGIRDGKNKTLIELRGEGSVILCAPSKGYILHQGSWSNLPTLDEDERKLLIDAAIAFDESMPEVFKEVLPSSNPTSNWELRPGDDFNRRGDIRPYLESSGWTLLRTASGEEYWRRPGQPISDRHGATFNGQTFHVFTCNASPFEMNCNYDKFRVYTLLEHNGDSVAAAASLARMGYGRNAESQIDEGVFRNLLAQPAKDVRNVSVSVVREGGKWPPLELQPKLPEPPSFPVEAMPECLRDMAIALSRTHKVPVAIPAVALLAASGFAIGRLVYYMVKPTLTGRANLYVLIFAARGERKSTVYGPVMEPFNNWINRQVKEYNEQMEDICILLKRKENIRNLLSKAIPQKDADPVQLKKDLQDINSQLASLPPNPNILHNDITDEALKQRLSECGGIAGIFSDDARGMLKQIMGIRYSKDGDTHEDTLLDAFDGSKPVNYERAQRTISPIDHPCVGLLLMTQNDMLPVFFTNDDLAASGLKSRCLFCFPESWVGQRKPDGTLVRDYDESDIPLQVQLNYDNVIFSLLAEAYERRQVELVPLTPKAKSFWIEHYREIEGESGEGGLYAEVVDSAIRYPSQTLRLALICAKINRHTEITLEDMRSGHSMMKYFIANVERIRQYVSRDGLTSEARKFIHYFRNHCQEKFIAFRNLYKFNNVSAELAKKTVELLIAKNCCRWKDEAKRCLEVNPAVYALEE